MTRSVEISEAEQERVTGILHEFEHGRLNSICPGVDDCQLWYDAEIRTACLLRALPYLAPAGDGGLREALAGVLERKVERSNGVDTEWMTVTVRELRELLARCGS